MKLFVHFKTIEPGEDTVAVMIEPTVIEQMIDKTLKVWVADGSYCIIKNLRTYPGDFEETPSHIMEKLFQTDKLVIYGDVKWDSE